MAKRPRPWIVAPHEPLVKLEDNLFRLFFLRDKQALRRSLEGLAALEGLARLVPSHGDVVEDGAASLLRRVASAL